MEGIPIEELLHDVERIPVDPEQVRKYESKTDHAVLAHALLRETAQLTAMASSILVGEEPSWTRDEAVVMGHLVRLVKLLRWLLEEVGKERPELFFMALRATGECVVNFRYLVQNFSPELIESYIQQSLQTDLKLEQTIERSIADRGGEVWPIERRMLRSIQKDVERSGIRRGDVAQKRIRHFGGKDHRAKAEAVGLGDLYPAVFGGPSRMVHGGWKDLTMHHLEWVGEGRFQPRHDTWRPSIQPLHAVGVIVTDALEEFFEGYGSSEVKRLAGRATELNARLSMANELHEEFLVRGQIAKEKKDGDGGDVS